MPKACYRRLIAYCSSLTCCRAKKPGAVRDTGQVEEDREDKLDPDGMFLCVAIGAPGGEEMDHPSQKAHRADPRKPGQDHPYNANEYSSVIYLPEPRDQQTEYARYQRFSHQIKIISAEYYEERGSLFRGI